MNMNTAITLVNHAVWIELYTAVRAKGGGLYIYTNNVTVQVYLLCQGVYNGHYNSFFLHHCKLTLG